MADSDSNFRISERTVISLHVAVILIGVVVWNVRLGDKVDTMEKEKIEQVARREKAERVHSNHERRIYRLESILKLKHPRNEDEGD